MEAGSRKGGAIKKKLRCVWRKIITQYKDDSDVDKLGFLPLQKWQMLGFNSKWGSFAINGEGDSSVPHLEEGKTALDFPFMHLDKILNLFDNRCMHQEKVQIPADRSPNAPPPPQDLLMARSPSDTQLSLPQNVRQFIFAQCFIRVNGKLGTCSLLWIFGGRKQRIRKEHWANFFNSSPRLEFMCWLCLWDGFLSVWKNLLFNKKWRHIDRTLLKQT